jgi:hypothetical protein
VGGLDPIPTGFGPDTPKPEPGPPGEQVLTILQAFDLMRAMHGDDGGAH